jgi:hypothetical protein
MMVTFQNEVAGMGSESEQTASRTSVQFDELVLVEKRGCVS